MEEKKYAYVSLFGVSSIEELRENLFVGIETTSGTKELVILKFVSWNRYLKWVTEQVVEVWSSAGRHIKFAGEVTSGTGFLQAELVSRSTKLLTKIWIAKAIPGSKISMDDIERRGDGLALRDLLGFVSQLKEQNKCQIILIFNEDELRESVEELN